MKKCLLPLFLAPCSLFAEANTVAAPDQGFTQTLVMVVIALVFFYLILWRPEQKRKKEMLEQRSKMKKGDHIVVMGVVGTISKIKETTVVVRSADSEIEFIKAAISEVRSETAPKPE